MSVQEAANLVDNFEKGTLPKNQWTHEAHFVMALWYCTIQPLPVAIRSIKEGIKKYNVNTGGVNTDDEGYHETITFFYTRVIIHYILQADPAAGFDQLLNRMTQQPFLAKDFPLKFYSKEVLMSREARRRWVRPDKESPSTWAF